MSFTLISATPSPFARMNRITMLEKGIPFSLQNEIPWQSVFSLHRPTNSTDHVLTFP